MLKLIVSTPGRICLFGEHQDYLGLPVIPAAISLRISIEGQPRADSRIEIDLPDMNSRVSFTLGDNITYTNHKDYFRSVVNVLRAHGFTFTRGCDCRVTSTIPIQAGTSSSSALVVGWVNFLTRIADNGRELSPDLIARYAHEAEVIEFKEAGGMMDQYSTAIGGVVAIEFVPQIRIERLPAQLGAFVLGDSLEPKDTQAILTRVREGVQRIVRRVSANHPGFSLHTATVEQIPLYTGDVNHEELMLLLGTIQNHRITQHAKQILQRDSIDRKRIGVLLNRHHAALRDVQKISTPKIERMIDAALHAGAYGAKINGSGGGGCMFAYAPEHADQVAEAIERAGGKAHVVTIDQGTRIEQ